MAQQSQNTNNSNSFLGNISRRQLFGAAGGATLLGLFATLYSRNNKSEKTTEEDKKPGQATEPQRSLSITTASVAESFRNHVLCTHFSLVDHSGSKPAKGEVLTANNDYGIKTSGNTTTISLRSATATQMGKAVDGSYPSGNQLPKNVVEFEDVEFSIKPRNAMSIVGHLWSSDGIKDGNPPIEGYSVSYNAQKLTIGEERQYGLFTDAAMIIRIKDYSDGATRYRNNFITQIEVMGYKQIEGTDFWMLSQAKSLQIDNLYPVNSKSCGLPERRTTVTPEAEASPTPSPSPTSSPKGKKVAAITNEGGEKKSRRNFLSFFS